MESSQLRLEDWASEEEASRAVLISNIPRSEGSAAEEAIMHSYSRYGSVSKIILQTDESGETQRAVVIYEEGSGPTNNQVSTELQNFEMLGGQTTCVLVKDLPKAIDEQGEPITGLAARIGDILARGFLLGQQGFAAVMTVDNTLKVTETVTATLNKYDTSFGVSDTLGQILRYSTTKLQQVDASLQITERATGILSQVGQNVEKYSAIAMQNPQIASGVGYAGAILSEAKDLGEKSIEAAKKVVEEKQRKNSL